jgi:hypothetical protein
MLLGQMIDGRSLSTTITVCVQMAELPEASVAVHTTRLVPTGKLLGASLITVGVPQLSDVVGLPKFTLVTEHWLRLALVNTFAGHVMVGASSSTTITLKVQLVTFKLSSMAEQVTLFVPKANVAPLVGLHVIVEDPQLSVALITHTTFDATHVPGVVFVTTSTGHTSGSTSSSTTVTRWVQLLWLAWMSVTVQMTKFVPFGNV